MISSERFSNISHSVSKSPMMAGPAAAALLREGSPMYQDRAAIGRTA